MAGGIAARMFLGSLGRMQRCSKQVVRTHLVHAEHSASLPIWGQEFLIEKELRSSSFWSASFLSARSFSSDEFLSGDKAIGGGHAKVRLRASALMDVHTYNRFVGRADFVLRSMSLHRFSMYILLLTILAL
jgi:hypothetical protein